MQKNTPSRLLRLANLFVGLALLWAMPAYAQTATVSNNSGEGNTTWFISNESTLVMNGFDLSKLSLPVTINAVNIRVVQPVAGQTVSAVIYEDSNGGSPQDARLVARADVNISTTGVVRVPLNQPVTVNSPVVWAGFYLPVDFRFSADTSGASTLTYWGWTPGSTFDLANLGSAAVFGPSDGTAPVNLNIGGIARITLEVNDPSGQAGGTSAPNTGSFQLGVQVVGDANTSLAVMVGYSDTFCPNIIYDVDDIRITANGVFTLHCRLEPAPMQPGVIGNANQAPASIPGFERRGLTYQIFANGDYGLPGKEASYLRVPVTHCITPDAGDIEKAVIAVAYGAPQKWYLLPTVRYGTAVCAELTNMGPVSYFVPRTGSETYLNANLVYVSTPTFTPDIANIRCRDKVSFKWAIKNDGFEATPATVIRLTNTAVRTGQVTQTFDFNIPLIPPGETISISGSFDASTAFFNEAQRFTFTLDPNGAFNEINEADNTRSFDYVLKDNGKSCQ